MAALEPSPAPRDLPVAVFRPAPTERVLVAGVCHAQSLCRSAATDPTGIAGVFADPCDVLQAITTAPAAVISAMLTDPTPFARLTQMLGASRVYLEVPGPDVPAIVAAAKTALSDQCVRLDVFARS